MRHEKCAVFQVTNNHGHARLICVHGIDFGDGAKFETELQNTCGAWLHITFLGRFDQIESASDLAQALDLLVAGATPLRALQGSTLSEAYSGEFSH
jgi:hypothetical protein